MARKQNIQKKIEYARRLKELKQKLKPYRNSQTVNLLRVITGSAGVNLNKYFEALENVLTGDYSHRDVKDRIQMVVNKILENGEYACKQAYPNCNVNIVDNNLTQIDLKPNVFNSDGHVKTESKANVLNNGRHGHIDLKPNVFNSDGHVKTESKANVLNNGRHGHIDLKPSVFNNDRHLKTESKASVFNNVRHSDVDLKANVFGHVKHSGINSKASMFDNVRHSDINLKASVFGDVKHGNIDEKLNFINRINHIHINSCNETCYRVKKEII